MLTVEAVPPAFADVCTVDAPATSSHWNHWKLTAAAAAAAWVMGLYSDRIDWASSIGV